MANGDGRGGAGGTRYGGAVAIVTGAASGIGRALAAGLVARGATVVVADLDGPGATRVADELNGGPGSGKALAATLDVTDAGAFAALVARTADDHGRIDLVFNNAGIGMSGRMEELTPEHWRRVVDVNLWGVVHGVSAAYPRMIAQGSGHIVNTASLSGLLPSPLLVPYSTTKHAVVGLSLGLRLEAASRGVRVSVVCPGVIDTPILDKGNPPDLPDAGQVADGRAMLTRMIGAPYPAADLARDVLDGVARNRAMIVTPRHARTPWRAFRLSPAMFLDRAAQRGRKLLGTKAGRPG